MKLHPSDLAVLDLLEKNENGLTCRQLSAVLGYTERTCRQAVHRLRQAGYRIGADRVFRVRTADRNAEIKR
jgi:DNA-binding IclR family transcriptional regulator